MHSWRAALVLMVTALVVLSFGFGLVGARSVGSATWGTLGASNPSGAPSPAAASPPSLSPRAGLLHNILAATEADHIPTAAVSLPNLLGQAQVSNGVVSPITKVAPAPMGIGTFGVRNTTGTSTPYEIRTSSWEGTITLGKVNSFWLDNDGALSTAGTSNVFGVQLNTVTNNTTLGDRSGYVFWTQNVFYWNLVPGAITFLDNVWNFSTPSFSLTPGTIYSGNGTPVYPVFYYDFGPTVPVTLPVTVHLYINSSTTNLKATGFGYTTIRFGYNVVDATTGVSEASGVYDTVLFNSTTPIGHVPSSPFLVDGSTLTPTNFLLYDAEIMIGGPGGGTTTSFYGLSGSEQLQYWDAKRGAYLNAPSAWNVGTDTGETSEGVAETYTTPGTVILGAGPSIPTPFWNATPGGNLGQAAFVGLVHPSNAFVFFTPGSAFNVNLAAWAPTQTASFVEYVLPPGTYTIDTMLSDYAPTQATVTASAGSAVTLDLSLVRDWATGVYTPLVAWDNAQLAAISSGGSGTAADPYTLERNTPPGGLNPVFGEFNDYFYPVFAGVLLAGTSAHVDLDHPSLFGLTYPSAYQAGLLASGLPITNHLQFEVYDASYVSIWDAQGITGWFFWEDYGPTGFLPLANVVIFGGSHDLVGDSTFLSQGSSLLLGGISPTVPTGNIVWGNTFENSTHLTPAMYPGNGQENGPPIGIFAFESGDLIYNNWVGTSITAYAPNANFYTGGPQTNLEAWNLPMVEPKSHSMTFNGFDLTGTIVPSAWQGGNFWIDYVPGSPLPYDEFGYIATGGDFFPYPIVAFAVTFTLSGITSGVVWSVTLNGVTETTASHTLVFYETPGTYAFTAALVSGKGYIHPSHGTITVKHHGVSVTLKLK